MPGKDDSLSFEPIAHYTYVVEGLGGPYFHIEYRRSLPWFNDHQLTYFKKNGVECGNFVSGIEKLNVEISISPNPSSDYTLFRLCVFFSNYRGLWKKLYLIVSMY